MKKIISTILIIIVVAASYMGYIVFASKSYFGNKIVGGHLYDCSTREPIMGAKVTARQQGWGWDRYLVWDKNYWVSTTTDRMGTFYLHYTVGSSANLWFEKAGYRKTQLSFPANSDEHSVRLLVGDESKFSYNCIPEEECLATRQDGNVTVGWNKCTDPEPKPYK